MTEAAEVAIERLDRNVAPLRQGDSYGYGEYSGAWEYPLPRAVCALLALRDDPTAALRAKLAEMNDEARLIEFARIAEGFCRECGRRLVPDEFCYCASHWDE